MYLSTSGMLLCQRLEGSEEYDPWGKGALQPTRLEDGSIVRHKNYLSNKYATQIRDDDVQVSQVSACIGVICGCCCADSSVWLFIMMMVCQCT